MLDQDPLPPLSRRAEAAGLALLDAGAISIADRVTAHGAPALAAVTVAAMAELIHVGLVSCYPHDEVNRLSYWLPPEGLAWARALRLQAAA